MLSLSSKKWSMVGRAPREPQTATSHTPSQLDEDDQLQDDDEKVAQATVTTTHGGVWTRRPPALDQQYGQKGTAATSSPSASGSASPPSAPLPGGNEDEDNDSLPPHSPLAVGSPLSGSMSDLNISSAVKVVVRFRPLVAREMRMKNRKGSLAPKNNVTLKMVPPDTVEVHTISASPHKARSSSPNNVSVRAFTFDKVLGADASQQQVFEECAADMASLLCRGYNATIFAYGQTGSGKTHSMFGPPTGIYMSEEMRGIVPRCVNQLFHKLSHSDTVLKATTKISFVEVYQGRIQDLLADPTTTTPNSARSFRVASSPTSSKRPAGRVKELKLRQSHARGVWLQDLQEMYVDTPQEVMDWVVHGNGARARAVTDINEHSSRSHTILTITTTQTHQNGFVYQGKLNLVDLAGSEHVGRSGASGSTLSEAQEINKSLSALGNVILALNSGQSHVPYRDSKLTHLLKDSLGGNTKTVLLVTCSPHDSCHWDTISSLKFAQRAMAVESQLIANQRRRSETDAELSRGRKPTPPRARRLASEEVLNSMRAGDFWKLARERLSALQQRLAEVSKATASTERQSQALLMLESDDLALTEAANQATGTAVSVDASSAVQ